MTGASPIAGASRAHRGRRSGLSGAIALAVRHPSAWSIALAAFLARGGIVLFALPIIVLPTPTGLATALGPDIIATAMGSITPDVMRITALAILLAGGWLIAASVVGAAADVELVRWAAGTSGDPSPGPGSGLAPARRPEGGPDEPRSARPPGRLGLVARVALVRLAWHLPLAIVGIWAVIRIVAAVYAQYVAPGDLAVPLPLRVIESVPDAIALLLAAWLFGEVLGGLAARGVVLDDRPAASAMRGAVGSLLLHPRSAGQVLAATTALLLALIALPLSAAAVAWGALSTALRGSWDPLAIAAATLAFAALWLGALLGAGVGAAVRSTAWTWHALRVRRAVPLELTSSVTAPGSSTAGA